jgi:hypothetical protein
MPLTDLSPYSLVVLLISLTLGVLHQLQATGKLFGQWDVPPKAVAYVLFVLPFVAGVGTSLTSAGALTALSVVNALVAGIEAVVAGAAPGVAVSLGMHAHVTVPKMMAALRKPASNDNAAPTQKAA